MTLQIASNGGTKFLGALWGVAKHVSLKTFRTVLDAIAIERFHNSIGGEDERVSSAQGQGHRFVRRAVGNPERERGRALLQHVCRFARNHSGPAWPATENSP